MTENEIKKLTKANRTLPIPQFDYSSQFLGMEVYDATPDSPYNSRETEILRREWEPAGYTYLQKYDRLDIPSTEFHYKRFVFESL
jgi:hypothetical protein